MAKKEKCKLCKKLFSKKELNKIGVCEQCYKKIGIKDGDKRFN